MTKDKALKMAIEALKGKTDKAQAIQACKKALEQEDYEKRGLEFENDHLAKELDGAMMMLKQTAQVCEVCGSTMTDKELAERKKTNPKLISCCPDRKMAKQPSQEPVALKFPTMLRKMWSGTEVQEWIDENTHPAPSWQGLSDDEMMKTIEICEDKCGRHLIGGLMIARAIEQALKEKNG